MVDVHLKKISTKTGRTHFQVTVKNIPVAMILDCGLGVCPATLKALCFAAFHEAMHREIITGREEDELSSVIDDIVKDAFRDAI